MRWSRVVPACGLMVALALVAAACGGQGTTPTPTSGTPDAPTSTPTSAGPTTEPGGQQGSEVDFTGRTVRFVIGFAAGGGYDIQARILAQVMPRYLPGNPTIVVENLPGAGGLRGKQRVFGAAPDGLTIGIMHGRYALAQIVGDQQEGWDLYQTRIIGCAECAPTRAFFSMRRDVATTWEELLNLGREVRNGETEPGHAGALGPTFLELKGYPFRTVYGYGGTAEILAAVDRQELDGTTRGNVSGSVETLYPEWIERKYLIPVFKYGAEDPLPYDVEPWGVTAEDIPDLVDLIEMTPAEREAFEAVQHIRFTKTIWLPPGTPDDILQAWRDAFDQTIQDQEYISLTQTQGIEIGYVSGEEMEEISRQGENLSPEAREWFKRLIGAE